MNQLPLVYFYCRESPTSRRKDTAIANPDRIELQIDAAKKEFPESKFRLVLFQDKDKSGKNVVDRPEFGKMIARATSAEGERVSIIACTKIDRFARSLLDLLITLRTLDEAGIGFRALQQREIDTTSPSGKLLLQILGAFAEFERTLINQRTTAGREKAMALGVRFGRPIGKLQDGRVLDSKKVMELHSQKLSARAIAKVLHCSITPVLRIIGENEVAK